MKAIPIHEAKANLSKYIQQAKAGKSIYIGSYGQPEVILQANPGKQPLKLGVWSDRRHPNAYKDVDLVGPDSDISGDFEKAINKQLP